MSEHTVTEDITQTGTRISGRMVCSCGLSADISYLKRASLNVGRARLRKLHEEKPERKILMDNGGSVLKPKKSKKRHAVSEADSNDVPELSGLDSNNPELSDEGGTQS